MESSNLDFFRRAECELFDPNIRCPVPYQRFLLQLRQPILQRLNPVDPIHRGHQRHQPAAFRKIRLLLLRDAHHQHRRKISPKIHTHHEGLLASYRGRLHPQKHIRNGNPLKSYASHQSIRH